MSSVVLSHDILHCSQSSGTRPIFTRPNFKCYDVIKSIIICNVSEETTPSIIDVAIVGGGAAGLAAAIFAARAAPDNSIVVLDGARKLGAKILVAGGGRCNVTNQSVTAADFCGTHPKIIKRVLSAFPVEQTVSFFREIGVDLKAEQHGKLFPTTDRAQTVLDALMREADRVGVRIQAAHRVTNIEKQIDGFRIETDVAALRARRVILATGGKALPKSGSDGAGIEMARRLGHSIVPLTPALVPFVLAGDFHAPLSGVAQDVELTVLVDDAKPIRVRGAMLWTHFGVSGPVVLDCSRHWHRARIEGRNVAVSANFLPGQDFATAERAWLELATSNPKLLVRKGLSRWLPARVAEAVLRKLAIDGATQLAHFKKDERRTLLRALLAWPLPVRDGRGYTHAEATAGGIPLTEIDPRSMSSRKRPGLFLVGEILDVDGRIGGFNFQWAWSSAWVAGRGIAR